MRTRILVVSAAAAALTLTGLIGSPALAAAGLTPPPSVDGAGERFYDDGDTTTASLTGLSANTDYYVGLCSNTNYPLGIPACTSFIPITTDGSGAATAVVALENNGGNAHTGAPGQPSTVNCTAADSCAVKVASHGSVPAIVDQSVSFKVNP
ncbi:hypothetical protein JL108_02765 [Aeromicrobium sp. YIM 150415]|uniref:hypothetical protein n=1 Tax=Aeromicrobium sp. YIM 150415 TaxID=2803912 RepID=UPI0019666CCD|nr:hypothetical protein [Aeromicrobium sp. YIM 150415]MBM9462354.1 hypothetical protein [Aeromicrobium sp. YIM 150415]